MDAMPSGNGPIVAGVALLVLYFVFRFRRAVSGGRGSALQEALGVLAFVALVAAFQVSDTIGYKTLGVVLIAMGSHALVTRRVPFGRKNRATPRYITGAAALAIGLCAACIGLFFLLDAGQVVVWMTPPVE